MPTPKKPAAPTRKPAAHPNAAAAIAAAQSGMSNAVKDSINPHFGKQYASLAAIRDVVLPAFSAEGVAVLQPIEGFGGVCRVRTVLLWGDQVIEVGNCEIPIGDGRNAAQDVGSIATYLRRYQLAAAGGIAQEDEDAEGIQAPAPQRRQAAPQRPADGPGHDDAPAQTKPATAPSRPRGGGISWAMTPCPKCGAKVYDNRGDDGPTLFKCANGAECPGGNGRYGWAEFDDPTWDDKQQAGRSADANDAAASNSANADPMADDDRPPVPGEGEIPF